MLEYEQTESAKVSKRSD